VELGVILCFGGDLDGRDGLAGAGLPMLGSRDKVSDDVRNLATTYRRASYSGGFCET